MPFVCMVFLPITNLAMYVYSGTFRGLWSTTDLLIKNCFMLVVVDEDCAIPYFSMFYCRVSFFPAISFAVIMQFLPLKLLLKSQTAQFPTYFKCKFAKSRKISSVSVTCSIISQLRALMLKNIFAFSSTIF